MSDGVRGEFLAFAAGFEAAFASAAAKNFFGIRSGEGVARDVLAAFDAFEQKRIFCVVREAQVRADGREQVRCEGLVDRDKVALARELRKRLKIGLNHRAAIFSSLCRARKTARRMAASGARWPVQISHCAVPCATNISTPETVSMPRPAASCKSLVVRGR